MQARPEEFRAAARALRSVRSEVDGDVRQLRAHGSAFESWLSPAASEFSSQFYAGSFSQYDLVIRDLDDYANMLEGAAVRLEEAVMSVNRLERSIRNWFYAQPIPEDGSLPKWVAHGWQYRPGRFPTSGDSEWYVAARYLRGLGLIF